MSKGSSDASSGPELTAKKTFRQVWEHGKKIEFASKAAKHSIDLFGPELKSLRTKLCELCSKILLSGGSSYSIKAEELLWKRGFYDVIQRCKQHKEALDGKSPLWENYSQYISRAVQFYDQLLYKLGVEFDMEVSQLSVINEASLGRMGIHWLKEVMYKCCIHLGDLARYQVPLGGSTHTAVAHYHRAITLDPTNGTAFNQLAVLMGERNEHFDSIYYYQRSIVSPQPFAGSEANMMRLFDKNRQAMDLFLSRQAGLVDPDLRAMTKKLLFLRFIQLQHALCPHSKSASSDQKQLSTLCQETLDSFNQCLEYDLQTFKEISDNRAAGILSGEKHSKELSSSEKMLLPPDVLLKLTALSILSSHTLRQLGSTLTQVATAFALSVFSTLLLHSYQRIVQIVVSTIKHGSKPTTAASPSESETVDSLERGKSIVTILLEHGVLMALPVLAKTQNAAAGNAGNPVKPVTALEGSPAKKKHKVVDRRRSRRVRTGAGKLNEEEESDSDDNLDGSIGSSDDSLSVVSEELEEEDLELLDSLSDSSTSEPEEDGNAVDKPTGDTSTFLTTEMPLSSGKKTRRRQIILAANFNMPPTSEKLEGHTTLTSPPQASPKAKRQFEELVEGDSLQTAVYTACSLVAEESSLMALRVFIYWLQSCPIIIATCTQSAATMWSRIASLINILPTRDQIVDCNIVGEGNWPLLEDLLLREFPPILLALKSTHYGATETLSTMQETSFRICSLQTFGHYLAEARTAPSFSFNETTEKFEGPEQKALQARDMVKATEEQERKQAEVNRSKLMKAMAQRRLQSEIESLAEATSKTESTVFTPYLIPDANSLCSGLHIVKKLVKTEKFVFVIAKAVIESLDNMKKSRESYAAREVIKFLEKELHSGNKFIQAQKPSESLNTGKKKPPKMELDDWLLDCLVDCACYFNQTYATKGTTRAVATLIVEKRILDIFSDITKHSENPHVTEMLMTAQQNGVDLETMIGFHINWSKNSKKRSPRKH